MPQFCGHNASAVVLFWWMHFFMVLLRSLFFCMSVHLYIVLCLVSMCEWWVVNALFFRQSVRIFLLNFHLYGRQFVHRIQCFTCHAANTHSLIHMNVWSTTTTAAKKSQKRIFSPNINRPVNQPASQFNVIEYSEILYDNNWTQLQIGAHFIKVREKKQCTRCTWRVRDTTLIICAFRVCTCLFRNATALCWSNNCEQFFKCNDRSSTCH